MDFQIIIDDTFIKVANNSELNPAHNKYVLSLLNDFEDGHWRFNKSQNFIWDNISETALSFKEREVLKSQPHTLLTEAAKNLRLSDSADDISKGSELAEIVLYGIMKHKYNALPVVPKIFYKQNSQDNAKGADSVHILVDDEEGFSLWFGEAKFFNSIEDTRLASILKSVKNTLSSSKLKKENSIITNVSDLDRIKMGENVRKQIKESLSNKESIDNIKSKINIPILLLHECEITAENSDLNDDYIEKIKQHHINRATSYFGKQIKELKGVHKYSDIKFHLILFPVPDKQRIVDAFINKVVSYKD